MKQCSAEYTQAMNKQFRDRAYAVVSIGVVSMEAQRDATITSEKHYLAGNANPFIPVLSPTLYATMEENVFKADGSMLFAPPEDETELLRQFATFLTKDILGPITFRFSQPHDISGLSVFFTQYPPEEIEVTTDTGMHLEYSVDNPQFVIPDFFENVQEITITPTSFYNGNNKRMRISGLTMGVGIYANNEDIVDITFEDSCSFVSDELPNLSNKINILDMQDLFNVDNENSYLAYLQTGQEIHTWFGQTLENGNVEYIKMPVTYLTSWDCNNHRASFTAGDRFKLFTKEYSGGNKIYERSLWYEALKIMSELGLEPDEYFIDDCLQDVVITNPMPVKTCAECLQLIANAGRCILKQDENGVVQLLPNFENIVEPTDLQISDNGHTTWSHPDNVRFGSKYVYADMTQDFFSADGSMYFLSKEQQSYLGTSFVSSEISDANGNFTTPPSLSVQLPASFTYYGLTLRFDGNPPTHAKIQVYDSNRLKDTVEVDITSSEHYVNHTFKNFDKLVITFTKAYPNNRVLLNKVAFGQLSDYTLKKDDMMNNIVGTLQERVADISVKVFSFEPPEKEGESPKQVEDDVNYTHTINNHGTHVKFENPLIGSLELAEQVARWLGNYYANNITYNVDYRGDPRIDSADIMFLENDYLNNLQVDVEKHTLKFNGAYSGTLDLRRALNMI
jgi:hypothetical protein